MPNEIERAAEFLEHYGVKGQRWGVSKGSATASLSGPGTATASLTNPRAEKRAQYKADLTSGRQAVKAGKEVTEAQAKALSTNAKRKIVGIMATYGAVQVASYAVSNGAVNKLMASAMSDGESAVNNSLKQVGNLSTYVLRQNAGGSWG